MQWSRVNFASAPRAYMTVLNTEASSMTTGYAVALTAGAASADGYSAIMTRAGSNASSLPLWIGVAYRDIPANTAGRIQTWGYTESIYFSQMTTSITTNIGDVLIPGAAAGGLFSSVAPSIVNAGMKFAVAISTPPTVSMAVTANYTSGILRCV